MRLGEVVALTWDRVDLQECWLRVESRVALVLEEDPTRGKKTRYDFDTPKSEASFRKIPFPSKIAKIFKAHKAQQAQEKLLCGQAYQDSNYVFAWPDGRMVDPQYLSKHFHKLALKHVGDFNFHSMRHTYATLLLEKNEHPNVVKELLGDSQISVVLDTYSHVFPDIKMRAASKLDDFFVTKNENPSEEEG